MSFIPPTTQLRRSTRHMNRPGSFAEIVCAGGEARIDILGGFGWFLIAAVAVQPC